MIALIQWVTQASVTIDNKVAGAIGPDLLILLGEYRQDDEQKAAKLCERVLAYRIFSDEHGKMNLSARQSPVGREGAACSSGLPANRRPSFTP